MDKYKVKLLHNYRFDDVFEDKNISFNGITSTKPFSSNTADLVLEIAIRDGNLMVYKEFNTDGCSPKFKIFNKWFGTLDGANNRFQTRLGYLIHDALTRYHNNINDKVGYELVTRKFADDLFLKWLIIGGWRFSKNGFKNKILSKIDYLPSYIYYLGVRLFGIYSWK